MTLIRISLPLMLVALFIGLTISLLQALTQIQEMTLSFVPKIIGVLFAMLLMLPLAGAELSRFTARIFENIIDGGEGDSAADALREDGAASQEKGGEGGPPS